MSSFIKQFLICFGTYSVRSVSLSQDLFWLSVPKVQLEMGKRSFRCAPPAAWNLLQEELGLREQVSLNLSSLRVLEDDASGCKRFDD